jgi:hypothetical protein
VKATGEGWRAGGVPTFSLRLSVAPRAQLDYAVFKAEWNNLNIHFRLTLWYWQAVELIGIVRRRSDVVVSSALIGLLVAMTFSAAVKPVFSSRAKVHVGDMDAEGHITNRIHKELSGPDVY